MQQKQSKKKRMQFSGRKIFHTVLLTAVLAGAAVGIGFAVRYSMRGASVMVVPVSDLNWGGSWSQTETEGYITSDATQDVYVSSSQSVKEVLVKEGQQVKQGDVLFVYDTAQQSIALEQEKLNRQKIVLSMDVAQTNLATLNSLQPVSETEDQQNQEEIYDDSGDDAWEDPGEEPYDPGTDDPDPVEPEDPGEPDDPDVPDDPVLKPPADTEQTLLDRESAEHPVYSSEETAGTVLDPFRYGCSAGAEITPDFIYALKEKAEEKGGVLYFTLEIWKDDQLSCMWMQEVSQMEYVNDSWIGKVELVSEDDPDYPEDPSDPSDPADPSDPSEPSDPSDPSDPSGGDPEDETGTGSENGSSENTEGDAGPEDSKESSAGGETAASKGTASAETAGMNQIRVVNSLLSDADSSSQPASSGSAGSSEAPGFSDTGLISKNAEYTKEELAQAKSDTAAQYRDLQLDLREADLKIAAAERELGTGQVTAALDGVVKKVQDPSNPSAEGGAFLQVQGAQGMYVKSGISEKLLDQVQAGDPVTVVCYDNGQIYSGTISYIGTYPDTSGSFGYGSSSNESTYPMTASLKGNLNGVADMTWCSVEIGSSDEGSGADDDSEGIWMYKPFIREENGEKFVYVRNNSGKLQRRVVETGTVSDNSVQVLSGLNSDDWVAFPYGKNVEDGAKTREGSLSELYQ